MFCSRMSDTRRLRHTQLAPRNPIKTSALSILDTLRIREDGQGVHISMADCFAAHLGLRLRPDETRRCLRRRLKACSPAWNDVEKTWTLAAGSAQQVEVALQKAMDALAWIAFRPLTPKSVCQALHINAQERLRWTRDGRLPSKGQVSVKRAHALQIPTYDVHLVARIAAAPDILEEWRRQDTLADP